MSEILTIVDDINYVYVVYNTETTISYNFCYDNITSFENAKNEFQNLYNEMSIADRCTFRIYQFIYITISKQIIFSYEFKFSYNPKIIPIDDLLIG